VSLTLLLNQDAVPNIREKPVGVNPEVHIWCMHSRSLVVFPNSNRGTSVELAPTTPPRMEFRDPRGVRRANYSLVYNVSFAPLDLAFEVEGFPKYYFDAVDLSVIPPPPLGIQLAPDGDLVGNPRPLAPAPPIEPLTVVASSQFAMQATSTEITLGVYEAIYCNSQIAKSREMVINCNLHDAHNFHGWGIYLLHLEPTAEVEPDPNKFFCWEVINPNGIATDFIARDEESFQCQSGTGENEGRCCCFTWLPYEANLDRDYVNAQSVIARHMHSRCGFTTNTKKLVMSMAVGNAPDQNGDLVQVVSREVFDYSIPPAPDPVPVEFELEVDIDFDSCSGDKKAECYDTMQKELLKLLGLPESNQCGDAPCDVDTAPDMCCIVVERGDEV
jgi:hypothetical protein